MTYRAWNLKPLDRAALRELTQAIAEQATEELEYNAQDDEPWSEQKYAAALAAQQKENALLAGVLTARGITDPTEALTLLAGEEELSDPSLLTDMDKACERIWRAIDEGETIVVFGDYDVDGVTATALLYQHLKGMGATVKCMLPSREGDGYGLSRNAIRSIHDKGCKLIVTVDNGISAVEEADYAAELGIDLIITDHHLPPETLPKAIAVVDPRREETPVPSRACAVRAWHSSCVPHWMLPAGRNAGLLRRPCRCGYCGGRDAAYRRKPHPCQGGPAPAAEHGPSGSGSVAGRGGPCGQTGHRRKCQLRHCAPHQCGWPHGQRCYGFAAGDV